MPKVNEDTYAYEQVGPDVFVRRQVFAGQIVPDHWFKDEEGNSPFGEHAGESTPAGVSAYKHQLGDDGELADEHQEDVDDDELAARNQGGILALQQKDKGNKQSSSASKSSAEKPGKS